MVFERLANIISAFQLEFVLNEDRPCVQSGRYGGELGGGKEVWAQGTGSRAYGIVSAGV